MNQISALAPVDGSCDGIFNIAKDFTAQAISHMFKLRGEEGQMIPAKLSESGVGRYLVIRPLLSIPLVTMIFPKIRGTSGASRGRWI